VLEEIAEERTVRTVPDVDVFLNVLRGPRPIPSEIRAQKRWESLRNEVTRFEEANAVSEVQIQNLKEEIEKLREKVKELHDFEPFDEVANSPPVPDLSAEIARVRRAHESTMKTLERQKKEQDEPSITMEHGIASAWERIAEAERKAAAQAIADSAQKNELSPDDVTIYQRRRKEHSREPSSRQEGLPPVWRLPRGAPRLLRSFRRKRG
jgi:predicted RNase H-like nuclease (RuvC/YqgF family)